VTSSTPPDALWAVTKPGIFIQDQAQIVLARAQSFLSLLPVININKQGTPVDESVSRTGRLGA
jgi:hypothetical protein